MGRWSVSVSLAAAWLFAAFSAGCDRDAGGSGSESNAASGVVATAAPVPARLIDAPTRTVAVLGDASRHELIAKLAAATGSVARSDAKETVARMRQGGKTIDYVAAVGDGAAAHAALARSADAVLLTVDATRGPTAITREHALLTRAMRVPQVVIAFARARDARDGKDLKNQEREVRDVLRLYLAPEDQPRCMMDDPEARANPKFDGAKGPAAMAAALGDSLGKRPERAAPMKPGSRSLSAFVYVLAAKETFARELASEVANGAATLTFGDRPCDAQVHADPIIEPAGNGRVTLTFTEPPKVAAGDHFAVLRGDHVTAVGTIVPD